MAWQSWHPLETVYCSPPPQSPNPINQNEPIASWRERRRLRRGRQNPLFFYRRAQLHASNSVCFLARVPRSFFSSPMPPAVLRRSRGAARRWDHFLARMVSDPVQVHLVRVKTWPSLPRWPRPFIPLSVGSMDPTRPGSAAFRVFFRPISAWEGWPFAHGPVQWSPLPPSLIIHLAILSPSPRAPSSSPLSF